MIVGGVFNSGLLAAPMAGATFDYAAVPSHVLRQAQRLQAVSEDFEVALPAAALQFVSRNLAVTRILFGARSAGEVEADVDFATARIDPDLWPALEIARR